MNGTVIFYGILTLCLGVFLFEMAKMPSHALDASVAVASAQAIPAPVMGNSRTVSETPAKFYAPETDTEKLAMQGVMDLIEIGNKPKMVTGCRMLLTMSRTNQARYEAGTADQHEHDLMEQMQPMLNGCRAMIDKFGYLVDTDQ